MLVLSRKPQETVLIRVEGLAEPIRVTIVRVKGDDVRIGFEHPDSERVVIDREEVFLDKAAERASGVMSAGMSPRPRLGRSLALRGL